MVAVGAVVGIELRKKHPDRMGNVSFSCLTCIYV